MDVRRGPPTRSPDRVPTSPPDRWCRPSTAPILCLPIGWRNKMAPDDQDQLVGFSKALSAHAAAAQGLVVAIRTGEGAPRTGTLWRPDVVVASEQVFPKKTAEIEIVRADGSRSPARVAGRDPGTNIVALQLGAALEAQRPESAEARFGALALALAASADGLPGVRLSIIRAVGPAWYSQAGGRIDQRISLDLRTSGREEGGPVVDATGGVLGISAAGPRGRALVIPSATIERVLDPLLTAGRIERGWLGAAFYPVALPEALSQKTGQQRGLMVLRVAEGGPAATAGVVGGDIVLAVGSATAAHPSQIARLLGPKSIGEKLELRLVRA